MSGALKPCQRKYKMAPPCGCYIHDAWTFKETYNVYRINTSKKFKNAVIEYMRYKNLLPPRGEFAYTVCVRKGNELKLLEEEQQKNADNNISHENEKEQTEAEVETLESVGEKVEIFIKMLQASSESLFDTVPDIIWSKLMNIIGTIMKSTLC